MCFLWCCKLLRLLALVTDTWMNMEHWWNGSDSAKQSTWRKTSARVILSTTDPTWEGLGSNPGVSDDTNCLGHPTAWGLLKWTINKYKMYLGHQKNWPYSQQCTQEILQNCYKFLKVLISVTSSVNLFQLAWWQLTLKLKYVAMPEHKNNLLYQQTCARMTCQCILSLYYTPDRSVFGISSTK